MEADRELTELRSRVDLIERELGGRVAVLERQVTQMATRLAPGPTPAVPPPAGTMPPSGTMPPTGVMPPTGTMPSTGTMPPPPGPGSRPATMPPPPRPSGPTTTPTAPAATPAGPGFEVGVEALLRWAGIGLVVLSAVFLVSTAISRGWIGPELQLLGATAIGFALLGSALRFVDRHSGFARAFGTGGAAVVIVCAGAAYSWLDLYSALTGLILVTIAAAISVLVASRLRMQSVAVVATVAMLVVPTLAGILVDAPVLATGIWLGLFAIAATVVGLHQDWVIYRVASTWATALWVLGLAIALADDGNTDHVVAGLALVSVVAVTLWLNPLFAERRLAAASGRSESKDRPTVTDRLMTTISGLEHRTGVLVPLWSWGTALLFAGLDAQDPGGWIGLLVAAGFAVAAVLAGPIERLIGDSAFGSHLLGVGLLVTVATVAWVGGPILIVSIAGQALATLIIGNYFKDRLLKVNAYLLGLLAWVMLAVSLADVLDTNSAPLADHLAHGVVVALLAAVGWLTTRRENASIAGVVNAFAWLAFVGFVSSVVDASIADRDWLVVGVVLAGLGFASARLAGVYVLGISVAIASITVLGGAVSIVDAAESGTDVAGHLANLAVVAALAVGTYILWFVVPRLDLARLVLVGTWVGALGWLASVLLAGPQGQVAVSGTWAVAACLALIAGIRTKESIIRTLGLGTLGVVLLKLLTVDLAEVDTLWRVGLFLVIGLGLLRLGYVLPSLVERYGQDQPQQTQTPPGQPPQGQPPQGQPPQGQPPQGQPPQGQPPQGQNPPPLPPAGEIRG